jgi:hypothetical protein
MLGEEANIPDVIAIEGLRTGYPSVYRALREHPDWFLVDRPYYSDPDPQNARVKQAIESDVLSSLPGPERGAVVHILGRLFPGIGAAFGMQQIPSREELYAARRVGHPDYFSRYFTYSVGAGTVAEKEIRELLDSAAGEVIPRLTKLLSKHGRGVVGPLTKKVSVRLPLIQVPTAQELIKVLPMIGRSVVDEGNTGSVFARSAADDLALLLTGLVERLPTTDRLDAARSIVATAEPLTFAMDALRWLRQAPRPGAEGMFDDAQLTELGDQLANRIARALADVPMWESEPSWASLLSIAAKGPLKNVVRDRVGKWLRSDPHAVDIVLKGVAGTATNLANGADIQQDFTTDSYAGLLLIAPIKSVRDAVRKAHGPIDASNYPPDASYVDGPTAAVIGQFSFLDAKAQREHRGEQT